MSIILLASFMSANFEGIISGNAFGFEKNKCFSLSKKITMIPDGTGEVEKAMEIPLIKKCLNKEKELEGYNYNLFPYGDLRSYQLSDGEVVEFSFEQITESYGHMIEYVKTELYQHNPENFIITALNHYKAGKIYIAKEKNNLQQVVYYVYSETSSPKKMMAPMAVSQGTLQGNNELTEKGHLSVAVEIRFIEYEFFGESLIITNPWLAKQTNSITGIQGHTGTGRPGGSNQDPIPLVEITYCSGELACDKTVTSGVACDKPEDCELGCLGNICIPGGSGGDCDSNQDCKESGGNPTAVGNLEDITHLECVSQSCAIVKGPGYDPDCFGKKFGDSCIESSSGEIGSPFGGFNGGSQNTECTQLYSQLNEFAASYPDAAKDWAATTLNMRYPSKIGLNYGFKPGNGEGLYTTGMTYGLWENINIPWTDLSLPISTHVSTSLAGAGNNLFGLSASNENDEYHTYGAGFMLQTMETDLPFDPRFQLAAQGLVTTTGDPAVTYDASIQACLYELGNMKITATVGIANTYTGEGTTPEESAYLPDGAFLMVGLGSGN